MNEQVLESLTHIELQLDWIGRALFIIAGCVFFFVMVKIANK